MTATALIEKLGMGNCSVESVLDKKGGRARNKVPKSVWKNSLSELVELARSGDKEAKTALKILSNLEYYKERY